MEDKPEQGMPRQPDPFLFEPVPPAVRGTVEDFRSALARFQEDCGCGTCYCGGGGCSCAIAIA